MVLGIDLQTSNEVLDPAKSPTRMPLLSFGFGQLVYARRNQRAMQESRFRAQSIAKFPSVDTNRLAVVATVRLISNEPNGMSIAARPR